MDSNSNTSLQIFLAYLIDRRDTVKHNLTQDAINSGTKESTIRITAGNLEAYEDAVSKLKEMLNDEEEFMERYLNGI